MSRRQRRHEEARKRFRDEQLARCNNPQLAPIIDRNIAAISEARRQAEAKKSFQDRLADLMTRFSGSMLFVYLHAFWFAIWIGLNQVGFRFDPFPYGLLTLIVSLEAIFLSTFVLLSQNQQAALADRRADLDLQINLLAEYEITRMLVLVDAMARKMGVEECSDAELGELKKPVEPETLLRQIRLEQHSKGAESSSKPQ